MLRVLLLVLTSVLCLIGMTVLGRRKARKRRMRDRAARLLIQESLLKKALSSEELSRNRFVPILFISWNESMRREVAFSGTYGVRVGRDLNQNQLVCSLPYISGIHCVIFTDRGRIFVSDEGSSNGTFTGAGPWKHRINGVEEIRNHTALYIGGLKLMVDAKIYDTSFL